jgi:flagellar biosynthesis protein FlhG
MARVIAVTTGKGGVGKSNFVLNVGICLAKMDYRVLLLDGDLGLSNLDILMGLMPQKSLEDVLLGKVPVDRIIVETDYKVKLLPASSGLVDWADLPEEKIHDLVHKLMLASTEVDFILVDTSSGTSAHQIAFLSCLSEIILGIRDEPTSVTENYGLIKALKNAGFDGRLAFFSSMVPDYVSGHTLFKKLSTPAQRFLDMPVDYMGPVCLDERLQTAVTEQVPVVVRFPTSDIAKCYRVIASTLISQVSQAINLERFWNAFIHMVKEISLPKSLREVSFDFEPPKDTNTQALEKTMDAILEEQRRTRQLLERLVYIMEGPLRGRMHELIDG